MNGQGGIRLWWLVRSDGATRSFVLKAYVIVNRDADPDRGGDHFESTIAGLEDRLFAGGTTAEEAENRAMDLLAGMLCGAVERNEVEDCFSSANGLDVKHVQVPYDDMVQMLREFAGSSRRAQEQTGTTKAPARDGENWEAEPLTDAPAMVGADC